MPRTTASTTVSVDGRRLRLTNLDKVLYPLTGTTKRDVLEYYATIATVMLPHTAFRPATRKRWPEGVGTSDDPGTAFFQKSLDETAPRWIARGEIAHRDHTNSYPLVNDVATLAWFAQQSALELHVPQWQFTPDGSAGTPDRLVLDLDPGDGVGLPECVEVARFARAILEAMGLQPIPLTSGSKGLHLYTHVDRGTSSDQLSAVARELARALEADHPELVVSEMRRALRAGRVFVDWSQNNAAKTTIAPYSLRGRERPWVAAPREWSELDDPAIGQLEFHEVLERVRDRGDLAASIVDDTTIARMPLQTDASLEAYRAKRDAQRTPEPLPGRGTVTAGGTLSGARRFVIHEHHARRLHWDLRLEREGVLECWAVPKGIPAEADVNRLAVQTEPHPIEYLDFSGIIPKGEYGAGEMHIWDSGEFEIEKWRDDELLLTLHGRTGGGLGGSARIVLIRTAGEGERASWLLHRRKEGRTGRTARSSPATAPHRATAVDDADAPELPVPGPPGRYSPMLATAATRADLDTGIEWAVELKWDGIRAIITIDDEAVRVTSRNDLDLTQVFPELHDLASRFDATSAVVDGEIVAHDAWGRPDFGRLQQRLGLTKPREITVAAANVPIAVYLFDALEIDGHSIIDTRYTERRAALIRLVDPIPGLLEVPPAFDADVDAALEFSRQLRLEGVVAKDVDSRYTPGHRSRAWLKLKHLAAREVIIIGWRPGRASLAGSLGSVLVAVPQSDGVLRYAGRVGSGFADTARSRLLEQLRPLQQSTPAVGDVPREDAADAVWTEPTLVAEVTFSNWTSSGRLRHPVWRGLRPDRSPADVESV